MGWRDKLKAVTDTVVEVGADVANGAVDLAKDGIDAAQKSTIGQDFMAGAARFGQATLAGLQNLGSAIQNGLESETSQKYIKMAADKIEAAKPLAGAVVDSVKGMSTDPATLTQMGVRGIGTTLLTGGMSIPAEVAKKVMQDPAVQGTLSEVLGIDLADVNGLSKIAELSNSDLARAIKDPSLLGVLQTAMESPEIQGMLKDKMTEMTPSNPILDATPNNVTPSIEMSPLTQ